MKVDLDILILSTSIQLQNAWIALLTKKKKKKDRKLSWEQERRSLNYSETLGYKMFIDHSSNLRYRNKIRLKYIVIEVHKCHIEGAHLIPSCAFEFRAGKIFHDAPVKIIATCRLFSKNKCK